MNLTEEEQIRFKKNQEQDRKKLNYLDGCQAFDYFDEVGRLTDIIGDHHFFKDDETRLAREIRLLGFEDAIDNFLCRCAALETSEVSEMLEEGRLENRKFENLLEESADNIIRTLNLMTNLIRIGQAQNTISPYATIGGIIRSKTRKNIERPPSHGNKRF